MTTAPQEIEVKLTTIPAILNMAVAAPLVIQGAFTRMVLTQFSGVDICSEADAQRICDTTDNPDVAAAWHMFRPYRDAVKRAAEIQDNRKRIAAKAAGDRWSKAKQARNPGEENASSIAKHPSRITEHPSGIAEHGSTPDVVPPANSLTQENASGIAKHAGAGNPPLPPLSPHTPHSPPISPPKKPTTSAKKAGEVGSDSLDSLTNPENFRLDGNANTGQQVPVKAIVDLYHSILPTAAHVDTLSDARVKAIKARWGEAKKRQSLAWWQGLFAYIRDNCPFLMGLVPPRNGQRPFKLTIDFVMNQQRLAEICEGKYDGQE